ncbi:hypothetical protein CK203_114694 [Vitis vinifera]|uniref:Uncharacterized protein n=1 Tax=Vitis vinifera TaxID=29760 RepID=A0A438C8P1_VITVI|nr:hypothetical protein CK203_114694 [Vitis vinifera]
MHPYGTQAKQFLSISAMARQEEPMPRLHQVGIQGQELHLHGIPPSEGGMPSNPPQHRYDMRRPPLQPRANTSRPKRSVCHPSYKESQSFRPKRVIDSCPIGVSADSCPTGAP